LPDFLLPLLTINGLLIKKYYSMKNIILILAALLAASLTLSNCSTSFAQEQDINLPAPNRSGGKPLMQALNERQTIRTLTNENLTQQQLSDLLWAAFGMNRPGMRTAPSAYNLQEIDIYVALRSGTYLYNAETHVLTPLKSKDIRGLISTEEAALQLILVADMGKYDINEGEIINDSDLFLSYANAGFISQNVYLYCASANLGSAVRGWVEKDLIAIELGLRSNQVILLAHTVGRVR
jgi:predicted small secreted protein/nitroreductase